MTGEGACRTAPATPGLLLILFSGSYYLVFLLAIVHYPVIPTLSCRLLYPRAAVL